MRALLVAIAVTLPGALAAAEPVAWRIVSVHNGDTVMAADAGNRQTMLRLLAIAKPKLIEP